MANLKKIEKQLKKIGFNHNGWGRTEVRELQNIILPDEEIYECVNGIYDGGFALLVATDVRVLLIDKKPLNYLTVEDLRFDMINELDYNHRLLGAYISISAGNKNLKFTSINQPRLRKLIGHVQRCMAEVKKKQSSSQEGQIQHLEQINQQLQSYLLTQQQQQERMQAHLERIQSDVQATAIPPPEPVKPDNRLADYLYAQQLLAQYQIQTGQPMPVLPAPAVPPPPTDNLVDDLYAEGRQEVYGRRHHGHHGIEINPLHLAYGKLPQAVWGKFGRPLLQKTMLPGQEAVSAPTEI
jgi:hypothetical protein